mgnify:CR=1 FL=1
MELIQRCQAGDAEAFATLFHQYQRLVYQTAYLLLGDTQAAEDALQEVFVKVHRSLATFDPTKGAFNTWLRRITVNHCLNARRRRAIWPFSPPDCSVLVEDRPSFLPEELALSREQAAAVWQAVQRLSPKLRVVVILRYYEELPYQEIAQVLDVPLGTVKWRLHEALKALRTELQGETLRKEREKPAGVRAPGRPRTEP